MSAKTYRINEVFYSLQGEGVRAGTPNVFVRFTGCNLACSTKAGPKSPGGFDCDTEFVSGKTLTLEEIKDRIIESQKITLGVVEGKFDLFPQCKWLILTGGEPGLQVDQQFVDYFQALGYSLAIETNGTVDFSKLVPGIDWITLSPKVAEHAIKQHFADELKYVRGYGQGIPKPVTKATHHLISPAFDGTQIHPKTLEWCTQLCLENPPWRLSLQTHKLLKVR